jgi:Ser/Thr protein kinase RdoA (MazF antagonist)
MDSTGSSRRNSRSSSTATVIKTVNFLIEPEDKLFVLEISNANESRDNLVAQNEMMAPIAVSEVAFP